MFSSAWSWSPQSIKLFHFDLSAPLSLFVQHTTQAKSRSIRQSLTELKKTLKRIFVVVSIYFMDLSKLSLKQPVEGQSTLISPRHKGSWLSSSWEKGSLLSWNTIYLILLESYLVVKGLLETLSAHCAPYSKLKMEKVVSSAFQSGIRRGFRRTGILRYG